MNREEALARLNAPPPPPLEQLLKFLHGVCAHADGMAEIEADLRRFGGRATRYLDRLADAIEAVLADPPPPGTLAMMVAWDANWVLDDPTEVGAAKWLKEIAGRVRRISEEAKAKQPSGTPHGPVQ